MELARGSNRSAARGDAPSAGFADVERRTDSAFRLARLWRRYEGPTWAVAITIYAGWGLTTWHYQALPWWLVLPLGGWFVCWHGSLQHEAVHGHPTRRRWLNAMLVFPPLGLWQPYPLYREIHLAHHGDARLTAPGDDPESDYVSAEDWAAAGRVRRALLRLHNTLLGRLAFGPLVASVRLASGEVARVRAGKRDHIGTWLVHAVAVAAVLFWTTVVCGIPIWAYLLLFAYPGLALTLLRSFAEHRAADDPAGRTAVVEAGRVMSLLYLNNNYHALHHSHPDLAWYALPAYWHADRTAILRRNGGYRFAGYGEQFRRFLLRAKGEPLHPSA